MFERYVNFKIEGRELNKLLEKMPVEYHVQRSFYKTYKISEKNLADRDKYCDGRINQCFDWTLFLMYADQEEYHFEFDMKEEECRAINSWNQFEAECWGGYYDSYSSYLAFLIIKARQLGLCQFSDEALECGFIVYDV